MASFAASFAGFFSVLFVLGFNAHAKCDPALTQTTLDHYNARAKEYLQRHDRTTGTIEGLYGTFVNLLRTGNPKPPSQIVVIDLGAGHGRETLEFRRDDFDVIPVEPAEELAKIVEERSGVHVRRQLAQQLDLGQQVDGVWAMASLIHVPIEELPAALERTKRHLRVGGVMFISICTNVGTPNVGQIDSKGRYFNRLTPDRWREAVAQVGGFEVIERYTGIQKDDFHGDSKPTADFSFFNLYARRVPEPGKLNVVSTKEGIEASLDKNHLWVSRNVARGQTFLTQTFVDPTPAGTKTVTWEYRLSRIDRDGDLGGQTFTFEINEVRLFEAGPHSASGRVRTRHRVFYVNTSPNGEVSANDVTNRPDDLVPEISSDPSGEVSDFRNQVFQRVFETGGQRAI